MQPVVLPVTTLLTKSKIANRIFAIIHLDLWWTEHNTFILHVLNTEVFMEAKQTIILNESSMELKERFFFFIRAQIIELKFHKYQTLMFNHNQHISTHLIRKFLTVLRNHVLKCILLHVEYNIFIIVPRIVFTHIRFFLSRFDSDKENL